MHFLLYLGSTLFTPCLVIGIVTTFVTLGYFFQCIRNLKLETYVNGIKKDESASSTTIVEGNSKNNSKRNMILILFGILFMFLSYGIDMYFQSQIYVFGLCGPLELSPEYAGWLNTIYFANYLLGRLISIPVSTFLSPNSIIFISLVGSSTSAIMLSIYGSWQWIILFIGTGLMGFCVSLLVGSGINWLTTNVQNITSKQVSLVFLGKYIT